MPEQLFLFVLIFDGICCIGMTILLLVGLKMFCYKLYMYHVQTFIDKIPKALSNDASNTNSSSVPPQSPSLSPTVSSTKPVNNDQNTKTSIHLTVMYLQSYNILIFNYIYIM